MGGVSSKTRWASYKYGIINFDTLLHLVGFFCMNPKGMFCTVVILILRKWYRSMYGKACLRCDVFYHIILLSICCLLQTKTSNEFISGLKKWLTEKFVSTGNAPDFFREVPGLNLCIITCYSNMVTYISSASTKPRMVLQLDHNSLFSH